MTSRWPIALAFTSCLLAAAPARADDVEIGYVEAFNDAAATILRHGATLPVAILVPVLQGDVIHVPNRRATVTLRLAGQDGDVTISEANQDVPLSVPRPPSRSYWSGLLSWVGSSVDVFDHEERAQVGANIRGGGNGPLSAPMLANPQVLAAGRRPLTIGWSSPAVVNIRIVPARGGRPLAAGKGVGGLWTSDPVDLRPGNYVIEMQSAKGDGRQTLTAIDARQMPMAPPELTGSEIPPELRETAVATWLAAQDPRFALESLQHVAGMAPKFRPADLLVGALIEGRRPSPPPP